MPKPSIHSHVQFARRLVTLLDTKFSIWKVKFGIDPLLDVIPGFGSALSMVVSFYLFYIAYRVRVPTMVYVRMGWNMAVDYLAGIIPFVGIFVDVLYKANVRNFALLEKYIDPDVIEGEFVTS